MATSGNNVAVALFGGTFNPVHNGHLKIASELAEFLSVAKVKMMPCAFPPHRQRLNISPQQRVALLREGIGNEYPDLDVDDLELRRSAPSYSIDSVIHLREKMNADTPLYLCLGMDAFLKIDTWHRWSDLIEYCHIVVCARPNYAAPQRGSLHKWINKHYCNDLSKLREKSGGYVFFCHLSMLPISSSNIRNNIKHGLPIDGMTPSRVIDYIRTNNLYEK